LKEIIIFTNPYPRRGRSHWKKEVKGLPLLAPFQVFRKKKGYPFTSLGKKKQKGKRVKEGEAFLYCFDHGGGNRHHLFRRKGEKGGAV